MTDLVTTLRLIITGNSSSAVAALGRVRGAAATTDSMLARSSRGMVKTGKYMTRHLTLPIVALGGAAVYSAAQFESSMELIQTQCGGTKKDVAELSEGVLALGLRAQHGPQELSAALYHLKSVGMDNVQAMQALTAAEKLASVGEADLEATTNAVAGAWRTGIRGATSFKEAVGTLNAIIGAGNLRMEELNSAMGTGILISAKTFGLSLTDVGTALATLTSQGMPATAAATRLRMGISMLGAPSKAAAEALDTIGLSTSDLAVAMREKGLTGAIKLLRDHLDGLSKVKQSQVLSAAFGGARTGTTIMALVDGYETLIDKQKQIVRQSGGFNKAVAAQAKTTEAQWHKAIATVKTLGVMFGEILMPYVNRALDALRSFGEWLGKLSPQFRTVVVVVLAVVAAAGPLLMLVGQLSLGIMALGGALSFLAANPVVLIIAAVVAACVALYILYKRSETVRNIINAIGRIFATVGRAIGAVIGWILKHWNGLVDAFLIAIGPIGWVIAWITHHWDQFKTMVGKVWDWCVDTWKWVVEQWRKTPVGRFVEGVIHAFVWLKEQASKHWNDILGVVSGVVNKIIDVIEVCFGWTGIKVKHWYPNATTTQPKGPKRRPFGDGAGLAEALLPLIGGGSIGQNFPGKATDRTDVGGNIWPSLPSLAGPLAGLLPALLKKVKEAVAERIKKALTWWSGATPGGRYRFAGGSAYAWAQALARQFGLGISSTYRPGAITASGNVSYHSFYGKAADLYGPDTRMNALAGFLFANGRSFAEIIHEHRGMKYGQPYYYARNDHFDHVHVARGDGDGAGGGSITINVVLPGGTALVGSAREVGEILAPHVRRALEQADRRALRHR